MCQAIRELMEAARNEGIESGIEQNLKAFVEFAQEMHLNKEDTLQKLKEKYSLAEDKLRECVALYWQQ